MGCIRSHWNSYGFHVRLRPFNCFKHSTYFKFSLYQNFQFFIACEWRRLVFWIIKKKKISIIVEIITIIFNCFSGGGGSVHKFCNCILFEESLFIYFSDFSLAVLNKIVLFYRHHLWMSPKILTNFKFLKKAQFHEIVQHEKFNYIFPYRTGHSKLFCGNLDDEELE